MNNYKSKYVKYKNKYLELKNNDMIGGKVIIAYIECKYDKNNEIFLTLFLQLLIEYEVMFDYIKKDSAILKSNFNSFSKDNWDIKDKEGIKDNWDIKDNIFLPIFKFKNYNNESINALLTSKEQINETIKIISNYCSTDIKKKCKKYREELFCNEQLIKKCCQLNKLTNSFYDSRNYSISVMLNTMLGTYNDWKQPPILVYILNEDGIFDGHIFILNKHEIGCLEAISIQSSLKLLIDSNCSDIKHGISTKLFDYVFSNIVPIFKSANYIYAYAWQNMSDILVAKYKFYTITRNALNNYNINGENIDNEQISVNNINNFNNYNINGEIVDNEQISVNSIEYALLRDLKDKASVYNSIYVFTVKKI